MTQSRSLPARADVPIPFTWDTQSVLADEAAWERALAEIAARIPGLTEFAGHLGDSPDTLADWFDQTEAALSLQSLVTLYASMFYVVDSADQAASARLDRARMSATDLAAATAFAAPEMLDIGMPRLRDWVAGAPRLAHLGHYLDRLESRSRHVRSAEVEALLSQVSDPLSTALSAHAVLANTDMRFVPAVGAAGEEEIAQGTIDMLLASPDRELRRSAWEHYADAHLAAQNAMAATLAGGVKRDVFFARARGYTSSLEAALLSNHIPVQVFHRTLEVFRANLGTWHRYWRIRRRALGLDQLRPFDTRARLSVEELTVPYEQAVEWISAGVAPLGDEYVSVLRRGALEERWVDIYPNRGKRMGAFSTGAVGTHPFIFMSYTDDIFSMSTLAHELGHSMHTYYSRSSQPFVYGNYGLFQAEVASNMNQALTRDHLFRTTDDAGLQFAVVEEAMANFYRYFFIMPTLARLELMLHQRVEDGGAITADYLNAQTAELMCEVYGSEVTVEEADRSRLGSTWAQFHTHLYANFYVYQYATGIAGAHHLARRVADGEGGAAESYLAFLKSGGSMYPLDSLRLAGVDMDSPEPVESAFASLAEIVDRLDALVPA